MDDLHTEYRLTIFREGNKTARHIPDVLDLESLAALDKQVASNHLDAARISGNHSDILKIQNEEGERIVLPRSDFVGCKVGKVAA